MKTAPSFIDPTITAIESHKGSNGRIAKVISKADHDDPLNRIAITFTNLSNERNRRRIESVRTGVPAAELEFKPERLLSFCQALMNQCCWSARRVAMSGKREDFANGIDFSQDVAEQAGNIESACFKDVEVTLMDDFQALNNLHSWLSKECNYLNQLEPLYLYAESKQQLLEGNDSDHETPEQFEWVQTFMSMNMDEVFTHMEKFIETLEEKREEEKATAARQNFRNAA